MHLAESYPCHAVLASVVPPAIGECCLQLASVKVFLVVSATPQVAETVVAAASATSRLGVNEIYDYNTASRKCFENAGFRVLEKTEKGNRFYMEL